LGFKKPTHLGGKIEIRKSNKSRPPKTPHRVKPGKRPEVKTLFFGFFFC